MHLNLAAALVLVPGLLLGYLAFRLSGDRDVIALLVAGGILTLGDLGLRHLRRAAAARWLLAPACGGVIFIVPVWAVGLLQLGVGAGKAAGLIA